MVFNSKTKAKMVFNSKGKQRASGFYKIFKYASPSSCHGDQNIRIGDKKIGRSLNCDILDTCKRFLL